MADKQIETILGGSPGAVLLKLALGSLLVGVILAAFGMTPWGFFHWLRYVVEELIGTGMDAVRNVAGYVISGALIVVPIWALMRLFAKKNP
jgi:hypothetical protein